MPKKTPKPASSKSKAVMDVSHPNKAAPSPNSKSVIVPSRPIMKDPMVKDADPEDTPQDDKLSPSHTGKLEPQLSAPALPETKSELKLVKPVSDSDEEESKPEPTQPEPEVEEEVKSEPIVAAKTEEPKEAETKTEEAGDEKNSDKADAGRQDEVEADKQELHNQKLIDEKRYFLPINSVEKRRSKRVVAVGIFLSLVLLLAWVNIALDAGLIELGGVKPVTSFFSN